MRMTNGDGASLQVATVVSWAVSALAAVSIAFAGYVLNDVRQDIRDLIGQVRVEHTLIEDNHDLIRDNQERLAVIEAKDPGVRTGDTQ